MIGLTHIINTNIPNQLSALLSVYNGGMTMLMMCLWLLEHITTPLLDAMDVMIIDNNDDEDDTSSAAVAPLLCWRWY